MVRIEINKKQLWQNFWDAFFYASWMYIALMLVGVAVGVVGLVFGIGKSSYTLVLGIAAIVLAGICLAMVAFQFASIYFMFLGKFKTNYPDGVKIFELGRSEVGFEIHNISKNASATLHFYNVSKIIKTKRSILIRLKRGTIFGYPRSEDLDKIFFN